MCDYKTHYLGRNDKGLCGRKFRDLRLFTNAMRQFVQSYQEGKACGTCVAVAKAKMPDLWTQTEQEIQRQSWTPEEIKGVAEAEAYLKEVV